MGYQISDINLSETILKVEKILGNRLDKLTVERAVFGRECKSLFVGRPGKGANFSGWESHQGKV